MILRAIKAGFVAPQNRAFLRFVDSPSDDAANFYWGIAALDAVNEWEARGMGGGVPHSLEWGADGTGADLR